MTAAILSFRSGQEIARNCIAIRDELMACDGCRCAFCLAPGDSEVLYGEMNGRPAYVVLATCDAFEMTGKSLGPFPADELPTICPATRIKLDIVFLDHDPDNVGRRGRRPNIVLACQRCDRRHRDGASRWPDWKPRQA